MKEFSTKKNECRHFGICSGCTLSDIYSPPLWEEINLYFKDVDSQLSPKLFFGNFISSRYKSKLAVSGEKEDVHIGLYRQNSHEVIDIPDCLVHHPQINKSVIFIKQAIKNFKIPVYSPKTKTGVVRYLQFFVDRKSNKVQLAIVLNIRDMEWVKKNSSFFEYLFQKGDIFHSIWVNLNNKDTNVIFSDDWHLLYGEKYFFQKIGKIDFFFHPHSFCQANIDLFEELLRHLENDEMFLGKDKKNILEIYAGSGAIGLNLAQKANKITLIEKNPFSKIFFEKIKERDSFENVSYLCLDAKDAGDLIEQNEIIIVDPPRKGLEETLLKKLSEKKSGKLIYVSCFFKTFKRDCDFLLSNLWNIKKVEGFLFFPGTDHVEILALFEKKSG